jgi:hypothetical protein
MIPGRECESCNHHYQFFPTNCVVIWYSCQPWMSVAQSVCPRCSSLGVTFFRDAYDDCMQYFITGDFVFIGEHEFAPEAIVNQFEAVYGVSPAEEVSLTARLESECDNLHDVLQAIPDELLLSMFEETEHPHDKPERWV